jgi:hypothetical protein
MHSHDSRPPLKSIARPSRTLITAALVAIFAVCGWAGAAQAQVTSDDFSGATLDTNVWTFVNPLGDGSMALTGSQIDITAPAGAVHNTYRNQTNSLPRISQAVGDVDFQIEVKWESDLNAASNSFRTQGILLEQTTEDVVRIEYLDLGAGAGPTIFVATIFGNQANNRVGPTSVTVSQPMYFRVTRTKATDNIVVEWSDDGSTYNEIANFTQAMTVNNISVYAGSDTTDPHTARVDYFFETSSPIDPEDCGNGIIEDLEACDEGAANGTADSCCSLACEFVPADTTCRGSAGLCDTAEVCSGVDATCPVDGFLSAATECRPTNGEVCDISEFCSGADATCPADVLMPMNISCRGAADTCDVEEVCTGVDASCPADGFATAAVTCRAAGGSCDVAEQCSGTDAACPADVLVAAMTVCRGSGGVCDIAEVCNGMDATCPANALLPAATECRASGGDCDVAEACTGSDVDCPADGFLSAATECRASGGNCDVAETCTGADANCPADVLLTASTVCRASGGDCDVEETCNGTDVTCPNDVFVAAATECRASGGDCDVAEACTGTDANCPADVLLTASTVCRASGGDCDVEETCNGTDVTCPNDVFVPAATECRASAGDCDVAEACTGSDANCPVDVFVAAATECRASGGDCDVAEACTGADANCPADVLVAAATECRASGGDCDPAEACTGVDIDCPVDAFEAPDTSCTSGNDCLVGEVCDAGGSCIGGQFAAADTSCSSGDECLMDEVCDAGGSCMGGRLSVPAPLTCSVTDSSLYFTDAAQDVVVDQNLVYVAALSAGIRIVDFTDPDFPAEVASHDPATCFDGAVEVPFVAQDVVLADSILYVSAGACGVLIFDVTNPLTIDDNTIPLAIDTAGEAFDVRRSGGLAYVADFDGGLAVLELATVSQIDSFGGGTSVTAAVDLEQDGNRSFLATDTGLRIVDDDPVSGLSLAGGYDSGNVVTGASQDAQLVRDGNNDLVYLARSFDGLDVLDVTDPASIVFLTNLPSVSGSYEVSLSGARAVTAEGDDGIGVLDIANLSSPISLGRYASEGFTSDVEMNDEFAFVAFDTDSGVDQGGLRIVKLERIGVDPLLVPEPRTLLGGLAALTASGLLAWRRTRSRGKQA